MVDIDKIQEYLIELVMSYGPKVIGSIIVLIIGLKIIKFITKRLNKILLKSKIDDSLIPFTSGLTDIGLKALLVISIMGMLGIEMTSFIAILGAAGIAIGMALSGTLQNFAGGFMILIFKPYKIGDFIEFGSYLGSVKEIQIFNTIITTPDNKRVIIPNSTISSSSLINYSAELTRRVDFSFGIAYSDNIDKAKEIIAKEIETIEFVLTDPKPFIGVGELADSSVNIIVRVWAKTNNYWDVHFDMIEKVKKAFDREGISIPFPQRDVYIHNVK